MPRLTEEKYRKIIEDYSSGLTQLETGKKNSIGRDAVGNILKRFNVLIREYTGYRGSIRRKWVWNYDFFYNRNKETAYWAGFLMADGCIMSNSRGATLVVFLKSSDRGHVESFCDAVSLSRGAIMTRKDESVGVHLNHKHLPQSLVSWGIVPRKSKNFVEPDIPTELLPHYLRGWCDGDGSVYRYGSAIRFTISSGSRDAMAWYEDKLRHLGFTGKIGCYGSKRNTNDWKLYIGGSKNVEHVCRILKVDVEFKLERRWNVTYS